MRAVVFCKTFRDDFRYLSHMMQSFDEYVSSDIDLILSMPKDDVPLAKSSLSLPSRCSIVDDESYVDEKASRIGGWMQQQVCKLSMYRVCSHDAALTVDSDTYFIRPVSMNDIVSATDQLKMVASRVHTRYSATNQPLKDFITGGEYRPPTPTSLPDTNVNIQGLLQKNLANPNSTSGQRAAWIYELFGVDAGLAFMPSQILSMEALRTFFEEICLANDIILSDLISIAPWEYAWYSCWVIWKRQYDFDPIVSPVVHFANDSDVEAARQAGITEEILAKRFVAVAMAARHFETLRY